MPEKNNVYPAWLGRVLSLEGYLLLSLTIFFLWKFRLREQIQSFQKL